MEVATQASQTSNPPRKVLSAEGTLIGGAKSPSIPEADLVKIYDKMLLTRLVDDRMMRLQRQGRLGFYMKSIGEEASHMAAYVLRDEDWLYPSYREQGAWFYRGYTVEQFINQLFGNVKDVTKGRQMPVHHSANWLNTVSISSPVGTQIPQAVGTAMAMKIAKTDNIAMTFFGEGTSSMGDFHVAMNFAGVTKAPCIFMCRNNGWAISVPLEKQTAAKSFAAKGVGYGMPGIRVDGNDVLAVIEVTQEAADRARAGDGPTLIECVTYRVEGHSSSDDPSVYRDAAEPEKWQQKDPLNRFRKYLESRGLWSPMQEQEAAEKHNQEVTDALFAAEKLGDPPLDTFFEDVYEELPWNLREQREYLMAQPRTSNPHKH